MKRVRFSTIEEAREALKRDKLGAAYVTAEEVFVATSYGTGTFSKKEWDAAGPLDNRGTDHKVPT